MAIIDINKLTPAIEIEPYPGRPKNVTGIFQVTQGSQICQAHGNLRRVEIGTCGNCIHFDFDDNWDSVHFACTHPIASDELDLSEMDWNTPACKYYEKE